MTDFPIWVWNTNILTWNLWTKMQNEQNWNECQCDCDSLMKPMPLAVWVRCWLLWDSVLQLHRTMLPTLAWCEVFRLFCLSTTVHLNFDIMLWRIQIYLERVQETPTLVFFLSLLKLRLAAGCSVIFGLKRARAVAWQWRLLCSGIFPGCFCTSRQRVRTGGSTEWLAGVSRRKQSVNLRSSERGSEGVSFGPETWGGVP